MTTPNTPSREPDTRPLWFRRMEALHEQLEANQAPRKKMVIAAVCIAAGTVVDHFGHPWISGVLILVGLWNIVVFMAIRYSSLLPDAHIYPDAYLYPELPDVGSYSVTRGSRGAYTVRVDGDSWDIALTKTGWNVTTGPYLRMLPHTTDGVRVPYPTLHAAIVAVRSLYNDPTPTDRNT